MMHEETSKAAQLVQEFRSDGLTVKEVVKKLNNLKIKSVRGHKIDERQVYKLNLLEVDTATTDDEFDANLISRVLKSDLSRRDKRVIVNIVL